MLVCGECQQPLVQTRDVGDVQWVCVGCRARVMPIATLERLAEASLAKSLRPLIERSTKPAGVDCPSCRRALREVTLGVDELVLGACKSCNLVRFAAGAFEQLPRKPRYVGVDPAAARQSVAKAKVGLDAELGLRRWRGDVDDLSWPQRILTWIGLPVDADAPAMGQPFLTWAIAATLLIVFLLELAGGDELVQALAWIPARPFRLGGLTLLTSFFLHAGWMHLLGNLYFLLTFGPGVEARLGPKRMVALLAAAELVGNVAHALFDPRSSTPCVGASGGLSALILFYAAIHPWNRFALVFWLFFVPRTITVHAVYYAVLWFAWQLLCAVFQHFGGGSVSALAHLGGALVGFAGWLVWRKRERAVS